MDPENSANYLVPYDERVAQKAKKIRCHRCGRRCIDGLTICPNCGRNLRAATSRWITRGIPWGLAALLFLSVWLFSGRSPLEWAATISSRAAEFVVNIGAQIEPRLTDPETALNESYGVVSQNTPPSQNVSEAFPIMTPVSGGPLIEDSQNLAGQVMGEQLTDARLTDEQLIAEQRFIAQNLDNPSGRQSTSPDVALLSPSLTLAASSTSSAIMTTETEPIATAITVSTRTPTTVPTIAPTVTSLPTPNPPKPTNTPVPTNTPTPESPYRVDQIVLDAPSAGAILDCGRDNIASWVPPVSVVETDQYILNLGYVSNQTEDQYVVTWIAKLKFSNEKTSWVLDPAYCKLSLDKFNNQWVWTMQVVDENGDDVSEPSRASYFMWRKPS